MRTSQVIHLLFNYLALFKLLQSASIYTVHMIFNLHHWRMYLWLLAKQLWGGGGGGIGEAGQGLQGRRAAAEPQTGRL